LLRRRSGWRRELRRSFAWAPFFLDWVFVHPGVSLLVIGEEVIGLLFVELVAVALSR
jgi:hypothetical protein